VRNDAEVRSLLQTIGGAALGVGVGLAILVLGFVVSRLTLPDNVIDASTTTAAPLATVARIASPGATTTANAVPAPPSPTPTPRPTVTPDPLVVIGFTGHAGGANYRLAALTVPTGYTLTSPIDGTIRIDLYQYVDGSIRQGVTDQPSYPYIYVTGGGREIKLRPGVVGTDVQLLVKDGDQVAAGAPILKTLTSNPSSWHTFYESSVLAQIVASVTLQGTEVDPVPTFKR
jgi:hypothetical protein